MPHFCTYFDHNYLRQGLALHRSLQRYCPDFTLHVLCLSPACRDALLSMDLPGVRVTALEALEAACPELLAVKGGRSRIEYYFTLTPIWPLYLLEQGRCPDRVTYLDSDLWFFSSPMPLLDAQGEASVSVVGHRFPPRLAHLEEYGRYNVGWLSFRGDDRGMACLRWYRDRCLEWCFDRLENGRFADQKYLDTLVGFEGVQVLEHPGANLAPWNVDRHEVTLSPEGVLADGVPLVFYHFHGLRRLAWKIYESGLGVYRARLTRDLRGAVYESYLRELHTVSSVRGDTGTLRDNPSRFRNWTVFRLLRGAIRRSLVVG